VDGPRFFYYLLPIFARILFTQVVQLGRNARQRESR
jgi:hypothetical protein